MVAEQKLDHGIVMAEGLREFGSVATVMRMTAPRVVARYPFIVTPSITEDFYLASWRSSVAWIGLTAAISLVLIGVGMRSLLLADRQLRRELCERVQAQESLRLAHEQLEARVAERTADLRHEIAEREQAQQALANLNDHIAAVSHRAGMAEVANSVLHNVGNVLNSVNVAVTLIGDQLRQSALADLPRAAALLRAHEHDLADYLGHDPQGRQLGAFLALLGDQWQHEHRSLTAEAVQLTANVQHIKDIVSRQQSLSGLSGLVSTIDLPALVDDVLALHGAALQRGGLRVRREHHGPTQWRGDRGKLTQILLNLVVNAEEASSALPDTNPSRCLTIRTDVSADQRLDIEVQDNGSGIAPEVLARLFAYGFTTKATGHGFGLHASAIAAQDMGGSLNARSKGNGLGATFILSLPDGAFRQTSAP
jgi:C4-dicarboxylate-specific signal transduction histidine kinase